MLFYNRKIALNVGFIAYKKSFNPLYNFIYQIRRIEKEAFWAYNNTQWDRREWKDILKVLYFIALSTLTGVKNKSSLITNKIDRIIKSIFPKKKNNRLLFTFCTFSCNSGPLCDTIKRKIDAELMLTLQNLSIYLSIYLSI